MLSYNRSVNRSRVLNPWLLFANQFYNQLRGIGKIKRNDAMKLAKIEWNSMSGLERRSWYHLSSQLKEEQNIETDNDLYLREFDDFINSEMFEEETEKDLRLKT